MDIVEYLNGLPELKAELGDEGSDLLNQYEQELFTITEKYWNLGVEVAPRREVFTSCLLNILMKPVVHGLSIINIPKTEKMDFLKRLYTMTKKNLEAVLEVDVKE